MNEYVLVLAPAGVMLGTTVKKLAKKFDAEVVDIEEEIKNDPNTYMALNDIKASYTRPINMETITHNLPRSKVAGLWTEATKRCLSKIRNSNKPVKFLSGHLIYYSAKRNEFYSVIDPKILCASEGPVSDKMKPTHVLLFIDDIYDMYTRLTEKGQVYSTNQIESFCRKLEREMKFDINSLTEEERSSLTMGWEVRTLLHLLSWRHLEPIMAENLALQLNAKFLAWSVKQLIESIKLWVEKSETTTIYLSHPISGLRREKRETGVWPESLQEINQLQEMSSKKGITLVMPTGIDELRFQIKDKKYTGYLEDRWPIVAEDDKILYSRPNNLREDKGINYKELLLPKYWDYREKKFVLLKPENYNEALKIEVNAFLQVLVREIEAQISSRDFLYIYHTDGLLVFRPYYSKEAISSFSGGVDAEVKLWEDIVQLFPKKRIAFVHFESDIESMLLSRKEKSKGVIFANFVEVLHELLEERCRNITRETVEKMVRNTGNIHEVQLQEVLNRANISQTDMENIEREFSENWKPAKIKLLKKYLTDAVDVNEELLGIWVFKDFNMMTEEYPNIVNFLKGGSINGNSRKDQIESIFPDSLILDSTVT
jgi:hypothetical protein